MRNGIAAVAAGVLAIGAIGVGVVAAADGSAQAPTGAPVHQAHGRTATSIIAMTEGVGCGGNVPKTWRACGNLSGGGGHRPDPVPSSASVGGSGGVIR